MKLNRLNIALAAGISVAIGSFIKHVIMWVIHVPLGMGTPRWEMIGLRGAGLGLPCGWVIVVAPVMSFLAAFVIGWLFAHFFNMLEKR